MYLVCAYMVIYVQTVGGRFIIKTKYKYKFYLHRKQKLEFNNLLGISCTSITSKRLYEEVTKELIKHDNASLCRR
jgi:hypothetical protein